MASGNAHRTHFGENFTITLPDGSLAHGACAGLGLERAAIALMVTHGFDVQAWPRRSEAEARSLSGEVASADLSEEHWPLSRRQPPQRMVALPA